MDHPFALKAWAQERDYRFPLLSDFWPHGAVAQQFGVFNDKAGFALRGTFLVRSDGTLAFTEVNGPGEARDQDGWRKALSAPVEPAGPGDRARARSSAGEHSVYTRAVAGSNPAAPTL